MTPDTASVPAYGITKAEHDQLAATKRRPLTQGPIRRHQQIDDTPNLGGLTPIDGALTEHLKRQKKEESK